MSEPSSWPLTEKGLRFLAPKFILEHLRENVLTHECYPTAIGYYPSARGHSMRRERHDDYLILYCEDGVGQVEVGGFRGVVRRGDVLILPRGLAHEYRADQSQPWTIYWCHFQGTLAGAFLDHIGLETQVPFIRGIATPSLLSSFKSLLSITKTGYSKTAFVHASNQLRQLLTLVARLRRKQSGIEKNGDYALVRNFMADNLDQTITLDQLASMCNLSKYHFSRRYKALTGYSPLQHFAHLKIEHACFLLDGSAMNVAEVAYQLGYEDPLYFSRIFKKITGLSPANYRNSDRR